MKLHVHDTINCITCGPTGCIVYTLPPRYYAFHYCVNLIITSEHHVSLISENCLLKPASCQTSW